MSNSRDALAAFRPTKFLQIFCKVCSTEVGSYSLRIGSVNVFKWQVTCDTLTANEPAPSAMECLSASLIAHISRSACAKSIISPRTSDGHQSQQPLLHIWVLNPNVVYSSSTTRERRPALKVLYREVAPEEAHKLLDSMVSDVHDLYLPLATLQSTWDALRLSSQLLPERDGSFKEWRAGLLPRWQNEIRIR